MQQVVPQITSCYWSHREHSKTNKENKKTLSLQMGSKQKNSDPTELSVWKLMPLKCQNINRIYSPQSTFLKFKKKKENQETHSQCVWSYNTTSERENQKLYQFLWMLDWLNVRLIQIDLWWKRSSFLLLHTWRSDDHQRGLQIRGQFLILNALHIPIYA